MNAIADHGNANEEQCQLEEGHAQNLPSDQDISPEASVRRETWWIRLFRRVVVITLLLG
jgi:hypothetical protein